MLSERPLKYADQKTERGKVLNPKYNIFRDQPIAKASPLRINTLLSGRSTVEKLGSGSGPLVCTISVSKSFKQESRLENLTNLQFWEDSLEGQAGPYAPQIEKTVKVLIDRISSASDRDIADTLYASITSVLSGIVASDTYGLVEQILTPSCLVGYTHIRTDIQGCNWMIGKLTMERWNCC